MLSKYLEDKVVFQVFYATKLSKRLAHDESISEEAEASMISKLREACGSEYINQLQCMFTGTYREQVSMPVIDVFNWSLQM